MRYYKKLSIKDIPIGLSILIGIVLIVNIVVTFNLSGNIKQSSDEIKTVLIIPKIELTLIKNSKCPDCFDISAVVENIKNTKVNITKEAIFEFDSKEGKELINRFKIDKVPTVVITGEINKTNLQGVEKRENALFFTNLQPPYTNTSTKRVEGRVTLSLLTDSKCSKCNNMDNLIGQIKSVVRVYDEKKIDLESKEAKNLINKYKIGAVPTVILSKDVDIYPAIKRAWPEVGSIEKDAYVLRQVIPPFINTTTNDLRGLINVIYLTDKSCVECYDVTQHKGILTNKQGFAMYFDKEETIDINDTKGKLLIGKYNLTNVPTIILSEEANVYPSSFVLKQFFSVEEDGSYIFRRAESVGNYKDLITNKVVLQNQNEK